MSKETKLLLMGIVAACSVYLTLLHFGLIWLGLFLSLLIAIFLLIKLIIIGNNRLHSKTSKRIIIGSFSLIILFNALVFVIDFSKRDFQKDLLLEIRKYIDEGLTKSEVQVELTHVLSKYYSENYSSIVQAVNNSMEDRLGDEGNFLLDHVEDINYFYTLDEAKDELTVIAVCDVSLGQDSEYVNFDGQKGRFEMQFTLTKEGVEYEVRN